MPTDFEDPHNSEHPLNRNSSHKFIKDKNSIRIREADIGDIEMGSFDRDKDKEEKEKK